MLKIETVFEMIQSAKSDWQNVLTNIWSMGQDQYYKIKNKMNKMYQEQKKFNFEMEDNNTSTFLKSISTSSDDLSIGSLKPIKINGLDSLPPREYIIKRLEIEVGSLCLLVAGGNSGKTMLAQHMAFCVSSGKPFLGTYDIDLPGKVLHIDGENGQNQIQRRYERLAYGLGLNSFDVDRIALSIKLDAPSVISKMEDTLVKLCTGYRMVIIDSLKAASEVDENTSKIEVICKIFKRVAEKSNCAIVLIHHKGKKESDARQSGRGHSSIYDSADIQIDLDHEPAKSDFTISCKKNRDGKIFGDLKYILEDTGEFHASQKCTKGMVITSVDVVAEKRDALDTKILKHLALYGEQNDSELYKEVKGDKTTFLDMMKVLKAKKFVTTSKGKNNSNVNTITDLGKAEVEEK